MSSLAFKEQIKPLFKSKLRELAAALTLTKMGTLDHDRLIVEIKYLMLGVIGENEKEGCSCNSSDCGESYGPRVANALRDDLRGKINEL